MKLNKTSFKLPKTILYFVLFLLIGKIFDFLPKEAIELFIIIWGIGNFIFFVFEIYSVTTKKQYTKTIYIVLVDILIIIDCAYMLHLYFMNYDKKNIEVILKMHRNSMIAYIVYLGSIFAQALLKSEEFN